MGNLFAESGLIPTNLQNSYESKLGMNDASYTVAVDNGSYTNFTHDSAGYGLAQWTHWSRKQGLFQLCKSRGKSIGDLTRFFISGTNYKLFLAIKNLEDYLIC